VLSSSPSLSNIKSAVVKTKKERKGQRKKERSSQVMKKSQIMLKRYLWADDDNDFLVDVLEGKLATTLII